MVRIDIRINIASDIASDIAHDIANDRVTGSANDSRYIYITRYARR